MWNHWDFAYLWMQWSRDKSVRNIRCPQGGTSQTSLLTLQREQSLTGVSSQSRVMRDYTSTEMPWILRIGICNLESPVGQEPETWFNPSTVGMLKMSSFPDFWPKCHMVASSLRAIHLKKKLIYNSWEAHFFFQILNCVSGMWCRVI